MKRILFAISCLSFFLTGCIKNDPVLYEQSKIEFDAATWNANAVGQTYPILSREPAFGFATPTSAPALTRVTANSFNVRVNLVGPQKHVPSDFTYIINSASTATAGTHFETLSGTGTIPADSSFGIIQIKVLDPGVSSPIPAILVLELTTNTNFGASVNYAKLGLSISQL